VKTVKKEEQNLYNLHIKKELVGHVSKKNYG